MDDLPQRLSDAPEALAHKPPPLLARAALYTLIPVLLTLALPLLLLFVLVIYALAIVQGGRIFVFSWTSKTEEPTPEYQKPHFLDIEVPAKVVSDEPAPPAKG